MHIKYRFIVVSSSIALVCLFAATILMASNQQQLTVTFTTDNQVQRIVAETATTPEEWKQGLMHRTQLSMDSGMLFIFDETQIRNFWMKNTLIPLDILFLDDQKHLITIHRNVQPCTADPCESYSSLKPTRFVIEVPAGFVDKYGITKATTVGF